MFVRAYDKQGNTYYKSMVYALINTGYYEEAIVFNPMTEAFELVRYLERRNGQLTPLYEVINNSRSGWVTYEKDFLLKLRKYCETYGYTEPLTCFSGYGEVFGNFDFMLRILQDGCVSREDTALELREPEDAADWNYIKTQEDADAFLKAFVCFHDSVLVRAEYTNNNKYQNTLFATFDNSGWYGIAELCFEGLLSLNLRPSGENYTPELYEGCLIVKDACIFWADSCLEEEDLTYTGSYIKALNLKWRKMNKGGFL